MSAPALDEMRQDLEELEELVDAARDSLRDLDAQLDRAALFEHVPGPEILKQWAADAAYAREVVDDLAWSVNVLIAEVERPAAGNVQ